MTTQNQNNVIDETETSNLKDSAAMNPVDYDALYAASFENEASNLEDSAAMENTFTPVTVEDLEELNKKFYADEPLFVISCGRSVWFVCGHPSDNWFFVRDTGEDYITSAYGLLEGFNEGEKNQDEEMRNSPHFKFIVYTAIRDKGLYNKFVKLDNLSSLIDTYKDTELFQLLLWLNWQIGR